LETPLPIKRIDMLAAVIPSKTRRKILELFFTHHTDLYYLRNIVRAVDEEVNAVKRELDILEKAKILFKEKRLNKSFYTLNKAYIFYEEFLRIFAKTSPFPQAVHENAPRLGKIKFASLSVKFIKQIPIKKDEVYFLLVGMIIIPEIEVFIKRMEEASGRQIDYTVMTEEEFIFRKRNNDPFLWRFLRTPKIMICGSEEELMK
jgi:hypothetical protein